MRCPTLLRPAAAVMMGGLMLAAPSTNADTLTGQYAGSFASNVAIQSPAYSNGVPNSLTTFKFNWDRSDLPAGPGVDTTIPDLFTGFCIELDQTVGANSSTQYNVITPTAAGLTPDRIALLSRLYGSYHDAVVDSTSAAAFQCAIYEIVYDGSNINLNSGNFLIQDLSIGVKLATQVILLDIQSNPAGPSAPIAVLHSDTKQDQLVRVIPTPASASLALLGAGLMARRRRA